MLTSLRDFFAFPSHRHLIKFSFPEPQSYQERFKSMKPNERLSKREGRKKIFSCVYMYKKEINFKTMESKRLKNLYFAGEVLNVDAVTGGFNFQNAWTCGYVAAKAIASLSIT